MFNCPLSSMVALRAIFSLRCRAEGVSENDKRQLNVETMTISSQLQMRLGPYPQFADNFFMSAAEKKTPLFEAHKRLGARIIPFGGWSMPVEYSGIAREHTAVRTAAGIFDVSHMGEFEITGPQALDLIQCVTSNDATHLNDGQAQYSALPTETGTVIDDVLVYRKSATHYMLVVNAANIDTDFNWIVSHNNFSAKVANASNDTALLAVQGPRAIEILQPLTETPLLTIQPFHFAPGRIMGADVILSRTGYTGEDGFELYLAPQNAEAVWSGILEAGRPLGLLPSGLGARNTLRLEARML